LPERVASALLVTGALPQNRKPKLELNTCKN